MSEKLIKEKELSNESSGLNYIEIDNDFIKKKIKEKEEKLKNNEVLNHNLFKLSDFDMEIIKQVPQGGDWRCLSKETISKSKRLTKINKTGGRTTFYGRMRDDKPSYTLTTYFNRPGSGCHIHPKKDRVISSREAARIQSFPDDFYFVGSQRDICTQIGNAVPPLFAEQLGLSIKEKINVEKSIDLFCGCGGFNIGFEKSGIHSCLSTDINFKACATLKTNRPNLSILNGDITKEEIQNEIIRVGKEKNIDIICGGPPCQGFSVIGKREDNDNRNELFLYYSKIVKNLKPKIIVFENVMGILSHKNGESFNAIVETFKNIGYNICMKKICMEEYGVPQKRKRVIIIGAREDLNINPEELFPKPITKKIEKQTSIEATLLDLINVDFVNPINIYKINKEKKYISPYILYLQNELTYQQFKRLIL